MKPSAKQINWPSAGRLSAECSGLRIQRVRALFVEFLLQFWTDVVGFHLLDRFHHGIDPPIHLVFTELLRCGSAFARVVEREAGVPPDAGVDIFGNFLSSLIST